ncbi:MAG: hypothetical protein C4520_00430 [Candidatus Abyssobacteria bacterium SURF_5]|uniref:PKD/Chitinase domain-containing protein n=1 Tax=Abyssobacteria bacterium (strain SURF_5) TaxID=2093360 RepID=A0A3A4P209_ABYX5|nr:MAG: hypothetical protein C4520_00430 [Candidatus Abyssubacteria bacterium SURF_5]
MEVYGGIVIAEGDIMMRKIPILLLMLLLVLPATGAAYADSAVFRVANAPQEDTCANWGAKDANVYNNGYGWQYFGRSSSVYFSAYWRWAIDIPRGSTITNAFVQLRADYTNSGLLSADFQGLVPDDRWTNGNGFSTANYPLGSSLNDILRQGTPVLWENIPDWIAGSWYSSPDISNLVQARVDSADYDPQDVRKNYLGLVLSFVSGSAYRTATQEPDNDSYTAQLYVEWIPGPVTPSTAVTETFYIKDSPEEDAYSAVGARNLNGYNDSNGWHYFGYAATTGCWYSSYWRWALTVPKLSIIESAFVAIRSDYVNEGYLDAAFQALVPDGKWEAGLGFSTANYPDGAFLNQIPRQGEAVPWNNISNWTTGTWFYSPDITALVQERIKNPDYDPETASGRQFGLVLYHANGSWYRTGTQEPDQDAYTAQLIIRWAPLIQTGCGDPDAVEICNDGIDNNCNGVLDDFCNTCPAANAGTDQAASVGQIICLDGSGSTDIDGDALTYTWNISSKPQFSSAELSDPAALNPEIFIDAFGDYIVDLIVSDGHCESAIDSVVISTINSCPAADAGPDTSVVVGGTAFLDGSASSDPDGDTLSYSWSLFKKPEGSAAVLDIQGDGSASFTVDKVGEYHVELCVSDGLCTSQPDLVVISTQNLPPVADAGGDQETTVGSALELDGASSYDPDGDPLFYSWCVLKNPASYPAESLLMMTESDTGPILVDPTSPTPILLAETEGQYVVQLVVSDGISDSEPDTCVVTAIVPEYQCPKGFGFWKNHPGAWPIQSLRLGNYLYQKETLHKLLQTPVRGDASMILAHQLIATKLNLENDSEPGPIEDTVQVADNLLAQFTRTLPCGVKPSSAIGKEMIQAAQTLESYNEGLQDLDCVQW